MQKKTPDYDNVFKTMKMKHKRLFMGGTVIETESEKLIRKGSEAGEAKQIIEMGQEFGLNDAAILERLQDKLSLSSEKATAYLEQYGKALV